MALHQSNSHDYEDDYEVDSQANGSGPQSRRQSGVQFVNTGAFASATNSATNSLNNLTAQPTPGGATPFSSPSGTYVSPPMAATSAGGGSAAGGGSGAYAPTRASSPLGAASGGGFPTSGGSSSGAAKSASPSPGATSRRGEAASPDEEPQQQQQRHQTTTSTTTRTITFQQNDAQQQQLLHAGAAAALPDTLLAVEDELRRTAEYKVAWDLELWRAVQRQRVEKEVREYRKKLHDEAKATLLSQEREIKKELEKAIGELAAKEKLFEEEERRQDRRKTKLLEAEREMERRSGLLVEHRRRLDEEAEQRVRRFKAEFEHKEELSQQRLHSLQDSLKRTEGRLEAGQKEYLKLWEEFAEFRTRTLTHAPSEGIAMERLRVQHSGELRLLQERMERSARDAAAELSRRLEAALAEGSRATTALAHKKEQLRQVTKEKGLLVAKVEALEAHIARLSCSAHTAATATAVMASSSSAAAAASGCPLRGSGGGSAADVASEVAALRQQLQKSISREQTFSPHQSSQGKGGAIRGLVAVADDNAGGNMLLSSPNSSTQAALCSQLERWRGERRRLLEMGGGAYDSSSPVIAALDANIARATARLGAIASASPQR